jgi:ABC-type multidrug transport system ATPase subunit
MSARDAADEHDEPRREDTAQPPARPGRVENDGTREVRASGGVEAPTIALQPGESVTVGSATDNQLVLPDVHVAPHQALLSRDTTGEYHVENLTEDGGMVVNGLAVRQAALVHGAHVAFGPYRYILAGDHLLPGDVRNAIQIDGVDLEQSVHVGGLISGHRKMLLDHVSLSIPPSSFVALIGGSGAGKTTLLTTLSGQNSPKHGSVLFNGENFYHHAAELGRTLGYVPQDDIIHKNLTVERALFYAGRLRLPTETRQQIRQRVQEVLEAIEMVPQRGQVISRLSGGERKRVNIAVELLDRPPVLFLDEPTSGLDPGRDLRLLEMLRRLADRGCTVILATHEMRDIEHCDYICFLAPGGKLAYFGPPGGLEQHFGTDDYPQIYNLVATDPNRWVAAFRQSPDFLQYVEGPRMQSQTRDETGTQPGVRAAGTRERLGPRQLGLLTRRYFETMLHDPSTLLILLAQAPIIAILTTFLTDQNVVAHLTNPAYAGQPQDISAQATLFILACSAIWFGTINAAREMVKEHAIYQRERAINLRILPYALSKLFILGLLLAVQCGILLFIVGLKMGYPNSGLVFSGKNGAFAEFYISLLLMGIAGLTIGLLISAWAPSTDRALSIVPIALIPEIIFANVIFTLSGVATYISWVLPARWGMQALGATAGLRDQFTDHTSAPFYAHDMTHLLGCWGALLGLALVFFVLTLVFLKRQDVVAR